MRERISVAVFHFVLSGKMRMRDAKGTLAKKRMSSSSDKTRRCRRRPRLTVQFNSFRNRFYLVFSLSGCSRRRIAVAAARMVKKTFCRVKMKIQFIFYEHILNPFPMCNHCFYVFSFILCCERSRAHALTHIPFRFHSIDGGSFNPKTDFVSLSHPRAKERVYKFTLARQGQPLRVHCSNFNWCEYISLLLHSRIRMMSTTKEKRKEKFYFLSFLRGWGECVRRQQRQQQQQPNWRRCRHQFTSMWHCDITPPNIYYVKLSPNLLDAPNHHRPPKL